MSFEGKVVEAKHANQETHGYVSLFGMLTLDDNSVTMKFVEIDTGVVTKKSLLGEYFHFPLTDSFTVSMRQPNSRTLCFEADGMTWNLQKY